MLLRVLFLHARFSLKEGIHVTLESPLDFPLSYTGFWLHKSGDSYVVHVNCLLHYLTVQQENLLILAVRQICVKSASLKKSPNHINCAGCLYSLDWTTGMTLTLELQSF